MRMIFMGTPDFAVPTLTRMALDGYELVGVYTQADKPKGRGNQVQMSPVKQEAIRLGIPVFQPSTLRSAEVQDELRALKPDVIVVVAYGKILPDEVLNLPQYGCINVHGSLLPKYRGAAPIQWSVLNGDDEAGVTVMQMDSGIDTGDMLLKRAVQIGENETSGELYDRLCMIGADACSEVIAQLGKGTLRPEKQPTEGSYAAKLTKEMAEIDWTHSASEIHNRIRGLSPWPTATTLLFGQRLKVHASRKTDGTTSAVPGEVLSQKPLTVACGGGTVLELTEIQADGSRRMKAAEYICGHAIPAGTLLGK